MMYSLKLTKVVHRNTKVQFVRTIHEHVNKSNISSLASRKWDAVVIGGGHNGLVSAAYLAKAGKKVLVLERRDILGGAAVSEEIVPGFTFSRASYLKSLFRLDIERDLDLKRHGLKVYQRNPSSFTPSVLDPQRRALVIGTSEEENFKQIKQFSLQDAENFPKYEKWLTDVAETFEPLFDDIPVDPNDKKEKDFQHKMKCKMQDANSLLRLGKRANRFLGPKGIPSAIELLTAPTSKIMDRWFESDILKATLATDSVIGAVTSPSQPQSGYVLLHHVMGQAEIGAAKGTWGYVEGGMGGISKAIAKSAESLGAVLQTGTEVRKICSNSKGAACGVELVDGTIINSQIVISNATPQITFLDLIENGKLPACFTQDIKQTDYNSAVFKINVALSGLPKFDSNVLPYKNGNSTLDNSPPELQGTIHLCSETVQSIEDAYEDTRFRNIPSNRPVIEMTIPSTRDNTLAPPGCHVATLFVQYAPYNPNIETFTNEKYENGWEAPGFEKQFVDTVFNCVEEYAPGFKKLVVGVDALSPLTLEKELALTGGNIFHGSMGLDQLYSLRPVSGYARHSTPMKGLYLCGSGCHPGGGVTGAPGRNCARVILDEKV